MCLPDNDNGTETPIKVTSKQYHLIEGRTTELREEEKLITLTWTEQSCTDWSVQLHEQEMPSCFPEV